MLKSHPIVGRFVVFILLPFIIVGLWLTFHLLDSLPDGELAYDIASISRDVSITRDANGLVKIQAQTDNDAYFALGFAHAQDRMWQLELQRRITSGRLSEVFGADSLSSDIWFRTLGLHQSAEKAWHVLSPQAKQSLTSYSAGINAWLDKTDSLPLEFSLLDITPEPWQVLDSLAWTKLFALDLSSNLADEIARLLTVSRLSEQQSASLFESIQYSQDISMKPLNADEQSGLAQLLNLQDKLESDLSIGGRFVGSNGWVVAPKATVDNKTILANDPHLGLQIPSLWYAAKLKGDTINASGMTLVGLPLIIFGHNQHIAWGGTNMMADSQDLFFEQVNVEDRSLYLVDDRWLPFSVRKESIAVKAAFPASFRKPVKSVEIDVRSTRNGPVVSDMFGVFEQPVTLRWTALNDKDTTYEAFFKLAKASDWGSFKQALAQAVAPNMNMLYADKKGNIGYLGIGSLPIRAKGNGTLPLAGWDSAMAWQGFVPVSQWPESYNPPSGYIVNANNNPVADDYPHFISSDFASDARKARIIELLKQGMPLTTQQMGKIQADTVNLSARNLLRVLQNYQPDNEKQHQIMSQLKDFDGDMTVDSQQATLLLVWSKFIRERLLYDELKGRYGEHEKTGFMRRVADLMTMDKLVALLEQSSVNWCDDVSTDKTENCNTILSLALDDAIQQLTRLEGDDIEDWRWGEVNSTYYRHMPFSNFKLLDLVFERTVANGGSADSINVAESSFNQSKGYLQHFGAGFRQVIAFDDDKTEYLLMNSTGQSGNVVSQHYDDMVEPFQQVKFYQFDDAKTSETLLRAKGAMAP